MPEEPEQIGDLLYIPNPDYPIHSRSSARRTSG